MKQRGGQKKHWAEEARIRTWYQAVKLRGWADYKLDDEFAWTDEGNALRQEDKGKSKELRSGKTEHRPRIFEWIRKEAREPQGRDNRWHAIEGLVSVVDAHPLFVGTASLYHSELWDLLQNTLIKPSEVQSKLDELLETHGLLRIDPRRLGPVADIIAKYGDEQVFDRCLHLSLRRMDYLSGIVLAWLLHLQTEPPANWRFRAMLADIVDQRLENFVGRYFPLESPENYSTDAIHTLERARLDMDSDHRLSGYGFLETMGIWPILPKDLVSTMTAEQLFANMLVPLALEAF